MDADAERYVASLDVGTTVVRCHIYNQNGQLKGKCQTNIQRIYPEVGRTEIEPEQLWQSVIHVIKGAIENASLTAKEVSCIGITTLRNTFITWDRETGECFHNFISWNDLRANKLVNEWNNSLTFKGIRFGSNIIYFLTRNKKYLVTSIMKVSNEQVVVRLQWALDNITNLRKKAEEGSALFGNVDTWLLWKLTGGEVHATDYSNASATALFDPFLMEWSDVVLSLFKIPKSMLPKLKDTSGIFGSTTKDLFGESITISAIVADQQSATFGQCCFDIGDLKCTLGTGGFLDLNTGSKPHASLAGVYPLVGWKIGNELVYLAEGLVNDMGTIITWAQNAGFLNEPSESSAMAESVQDTDGVFFIPAFAGLQVPVNDGKASAGFIGIKPSTTKAHIVRSLLEALIFRIHQLYEVVDSETKYKLNHLRVDGGVSNNDFILQNIANLTGQIIERPEHTEMTCLGATYLAGLAVGIWKSKEELRKLRKTCTLFHPQEVAVSMKQSAELWVTAVQRFLNWY